MAATSATVDEYVASVPPAMQEVLQDVRRTMHTVRPDAAETISYNIPTLTLDGRSLVHFAGRKRHVSVYPIPDGDDAYEAQLASYRSGASTAKFPLGKPIPLDLIARITKLLGEQHGPGQNLRIAQPVCRTAGGTGRSAARCSRTRLSDGDDSSHYRRGMRLREEMQKAASALPIVAGERPRRRRWLVVPLRCALPLDDDGYTVALHTAACRSDVPEEHAPEIGVRQLFAVDMRHHHRTVRMSIGD